jgi:hypothetical protein
VLPQPFSKHQAQQHVQFDQQGLVQYFPAYFQVCEGGVVYMACLHIIWCGSKSWLVHASRMVSYVRLT